MLIFNTTLDSLVARDNEETSASKRDVSARKVRDNSLTSAIFIIAFLRWNEFICSVGYLRDFCIEKLWLWWKPRAFLVLQSIHRQRLTQKCRAASTKWRLLHFASCSVSCVHDWKQMQQFCCQKRYKNCVPLRSAYTTKVANLTSRDKVERSPSAGHKNRKDYICTGQATNQFSAVLDIPS